jgi:hypothetical protein
MSKHCISLKCKQNVLWRCLKSRYTDNLFLNRMITPVEDAACSEADKTRGKES